MLHCLRRGIPFWLTDTTQGPTVSLAVLLVALVFRLTVNATVAGPVPPLTEGTSQLWLEATAHVHPGSVNALTSPLPPVAGTLSEVGDTP